MTNRNIRLTKREGPIVRCLLSALFVAVAGIMLVHDAAYAQRLGFVTGREPHGVDVYDMAMTPSMRW